MSAYKTLEVEARKLVFWDKNSCRLLIDKSGYEDRKSNIKFVSCFACEIAEGLLACVKADAIENLSKIIQIGFMFEFKEKSMFLLLTSEYLELFAEDEKFLDAAFLLPKQCPVIRYLPILPPIDDKSQLLTQPKPQGESEKSSKLYRSSKVQFFSLSKAQFSTAGVIRPTHARIFPEEASTMMELLIPGVSV